MFQNRNLALLLVTLGVCAPACSSETEADSPAGADAAQRAGGAGGSGQTGGQGAVGGQATGGDPMAPGGATADVLVRLPDVGVADLGGVAPPDAFVPIPDAGPLPGGERPSRFFLPSTPAPAEGFPLVMLLHGYMAGSVLIDRQMGFSQRVEADGFALLLPDGLPDESNALHWNADGTGEPDDIAYLTGLVRETIDRYPIDASRVYLVGHSNGGSMAYRLACDRPEVFAAVAPASVLNGIDPATCVQGTPFNLLHVHGDQDQSHPYEGTPERLGVEAILARYVSQANCMGPAPLEEPAIDAELTAAGAETLPLIHTGCNGGTVIGRWRMQNVGHVFIMTPAGTERLLHDLLAMRRTL